MESSKYMDALVLNIYKNCLSKCVHKYRYDEKIKIQQILSLAIVNKDITALEELLVYYEGVATMYNIAIKYEIR